MTNLKMGPMPPLSKKDSDLLSIGDWMALSEGEFHELVRQRVLKTGNVGDSFPLMVAYNVPFYILATLWPDRYAQVLDDPRYIAFAAAEPGWKGQTRNIQSAAEIQQPDQAPGDSPDSGAPAYRLRFEKSYVISCQQLLVLVRLAAEPETLALAWIQADPDRQQWRSRQEEGVRFELTGGPVFDHHFVSGDATIPADDLLTLHQRTYARIGLEVPRREVTTMAILAAAFAEHHEWFSADERKQLLDDPREQIIAARSAGRIRSNQVRAAGGMIDAMLGRAAERHFELGPFWAVIRQFRERVVRS